MHGGILARRDMPEDIADLERHGLEPIDLVCVNLYPFEQTVGGLEVGWEEAIEKIDVGGPAMLRAAAKNHAHVDPASAARRTTSRYSPSCGAQARFPRRPVACSPHMPSRQRRPTTARSLAGSAATSVFRWSSLRSSTVTASSSYGENPHQQAAYYTERGARTHLLARVEQLHGKGLSYNNLNDLSAARLLAQELEERRPA